MERPFLTFGVGSYLDLVEDRNYYPEAFTNYGCTSYHEYRNRAIHKEISFTISLNDYKTLTTGSCYLCGKETSDVHCNGIDRFDNSVGYDLENCRSCCANCNYMKKTYSYDEFIDKLLDIYKTHKNGTDIDPNCILNSSMSKGNRLPPDELANILIQKRNQKKEELLLNYSDENIKMNAVKIAEARRLKKQDRVQVFPNTTETVSHKPL